MASAFGKILLITGNAEFLSERTRARAVAAIAGEDAQCEVATATATGLGAGEIAGLTSPSLFSSSSALVITELQDLPDAAQAELLEYAKAPSPETAVVLVHGGGQKGKGLLDKLRAQSAVHEVKHEAPKYERDHARWVATELRDLGVRIDEQAATLLVASVGQDLRALAGAADQLAVSVEQGADITVEVVRRYFGGRADVRGYEIADAAIDGRLALALEQARWAETAKVAPVLVTSAVASGLRSLARLADAPQGLAQGDLARHVGVPPFKLKVMRRQLGSWSPAALAAALDAVARADLDVKGGASDPAFAVERMVLQVSAARGR
ncbi:DNA polymerase III subunit delta [Aeromicrobium sp. CTD01-1L150]|uniref:DNA polymerase III subunit delta n=1 Tax=Aeromicrobium sp. CTD01-1L150 TaxID=3341830 RepID=UPI0035C14967